MYRAMRAMNSDEGMSLLELVIAAAILFIAVTSVFGLLIASTNMSVFAKQQNTTTNAATNYMEYVRSLPYAAVGVQGTSVPGSLTVETSMAVAGVSVVIRPGVEYVDDPDIEGPKNYKRVDVWVKTTVGNTGRVLEQTYTTYVRDSDTLGGLTSLIAPPEIEFDDAQSPGNGDTVFGSVQVAARAKSVGANLSAVNFRVDGALMQGGGIFPIPDNAGVAEWTSIGDPGPIDFSMLWDTAATDGGGVPLYPDGLRNIQLAATDDLGQTSPRVRSVLVDNAAPSAPATVTGSADTSSTGTASWALAMDGTDAAPWYGLTVHEQSGSGDDSWETTYETPAHIAVTTADHPATWFSRYRAVAQAFSSRGLAGATRMTDDGYVSRSQIYGTATAVYVGTLPKRWVVTVQPKLTPPTFPYYDITNTWYRADVPAGPWTQVGASGPSFTPAADAPFSNPSSLKDPTKIPVKYYKVKSVVTPKGWPSYASNSTVEVWSGIVCNQRLDGPSSLVFYQW